MAFCLRNLNLINLTFPSKITHPTATIIKQPSQSNRFPLTQKPTLTSILTHQQQHLIFKRHKCAPNPNEFYDDSIIDLSVQEFSKILNSNIKEKNIKLIDVREPWEYDICNLPKFELKPLSKIADWAPELLSDTDKNADIYFLCHHGIRSKSVSQIFIQNGFQNVYNIDGGIEAYSNLVDPKVPKY